MPNKQNDTNPATSNIILFLPLIIIALLILTLLASRHFRRVPTENQQAEDLPPVPNQAENREIDNDEEGEDEVDDSGPVVRRVGKKKAEKMRRKEQRRQYNEWMEHQREDQRIRQELIDEENEKRQKAEKKIKKKEEQRRAKEKEFQRKERLRQLELRKRQQEEDRVKEEELIAKLMDLLRDIRTRITTFVESGKVVGVFDEHDHFIQVTPREIESMAAHIKDRGRISKNELAEWCTENVALVHL
ncbi:hypothetical protein HK097_000469 [Rhizophlyctis rosea]|uniref:DDRGK domain-containing protein 1 n=1 Tax=Rhizophlyctis rosea TaxID=64517 RepID=A0AAD5SJR7_9FUNG|nr:hypothetical protein HK097_000469 [Rhizophlyctis rosea]